MSSAEFVTLNELFTSPGENTKTHLDGTEEKKFTKSNNFNKSDSEITKAFFKNFTFNDIKVKFSVDTNVHMYLLDAECKNGDKRICHIKVATDKLIITESFVTNGEKSSAKFQDLVTEIKQRGIATSKSGEFKIGVDQMSVFAEAVEAVISK